MPIPGVTLLRPGLCEHFHCVGDQGVAPIAGLATISGDRLSLVALFLSNDGKTERRGRSEGAIADAVELGTDLGMRLREAAGWEFALAMRN